jgi:hypothetical protein
MDQVDSSHVSALLDSEEIPACYESRIFIIVWIKTRQ